MTPLEKSEVDQYRLKKLVKSAAHGDGEAAGLLFDLYHPRVYRYALAKLRDAPAAEDVASETFARVLRDLGHFTWRGAGFEAWLFRIAANLVLDHVRAGLRERAAEDIEFAETAELRTPEWAVLEGETTRELNRLLVMLSEEQREVLLLRFAGGLDTNEVGAVTGRKPNAVRQMQFRALEHLRASLTHGAQKR